MSEHFEDVVKYVMSEDESDLSRVRAERDYALHALEREIAIAQSEQAKNAVLVKVLQLARARIEYLGAVCNDPRHFTANAEHWLPDIDKALNGVVGEAPK